MNTTYKHIETLEDKAIELAAARENARCAAIKDLILARRVLIKTGDEEAAQVIGRLLGDKLGVQAGEGEERFLALMDIIL